MYTKVWCFKIDTLELNRPVKFLKSYMLYILYAYTASSSIDCSQIANEHCHEKTAFLHMRKQRWVSAATGNLAADQRL